jgi:hypothetical protein
MLLLLLLLPLLLSLLLPSPHGQLCRQSLRYLLLYQTAARFVATICQGKASLFDTHQAVASACAGTAAAAAAAVALQ